MLPTHIDEACDEIDAALFTGDTFHDHEMITELEAYLSRWQREIAATKKFLKEVEDEIDEQS